MRKIFVDIIEWVWIILVVIFLKQLDDRVESLEKQVDELYRIEEVLSEYADEELTIGSNGPDGEQI